MSSLVYNLRNHFEEVGAEKWWTGVFTILFVFASYLAMRYTAIPQPRFKTERFAEIDFTKFIAPEPPLPKPRQITKEKIAATTAQPEPAPSAPQQAPEPELNVFESLSKPVVVTPPTASVHDQLTPDNLSFANGKVALPLSNIDIAGKVAGPHAASTPLRTKPALPNSIQLPEVNVTSGNLPGGNLPAIQHLPPGLKNTGSANGNVHQPKMAIAPSARSRLSGNGASPALVAADVPKRPAEQTVEKNVQKIEVKNFANLDLKKIFKVLLIKLVEWLKQNHKELSPAVKHFMSYKPGDLTTEVTIEAEHQVYELFIRCNMSSEEVGILMAGAGENGEAIYLRDVGFKQQSHYLGLGLVGRNENDEVFTISMREETPTKEQTARFYNIFLSWWKANNP